MNLLQHPNCHNEKVVTVLAVLIVVHFYDNELIFLKKSRKKVLVVGFISDNPVVMRLCTDGEMLK